MRGKAAMSQVDWIVKFTPEAESDLDRIAAYIYGEYGFESLEKLLKDFEKVRQSLATWPMRCASVKGFHADIKQIFVRKKMYRMIYEVFESEKLVVIYVVARQNQEYKDIVAERLLSF